MRVMIWITICKLPFVVVFETNWFTVVLYNIHCSLCAGFRRWSRVNQIIHSCHC